MYQSISAGTRRGMQWRLTGFVAVGAVAIAGVGCIAAPGDIKPAAAAQRASQVPETALAREKGLTLLARTNSWDGSRLVPRQLVPVRLYLQNESGETVSVEHSDITLVGKKHQLRALEPDKVSIALSLLDDVSLADSLFMDEPEASQAALPEKPIENGEGVGGFVYFQPLPKDAGQLQLEIPVRSTREGTTIGILRVPLMVE